MIATILNLLTKGDCAKWTFWKTCSIQATADIKEGVDSCKMMIITMMTMTTIMIITTNILLHQTSRFLPTRPRFYRVLFAAIVPHRQFRVQNFVMAVAQPSRSIQIVPVAVQNYPPVHSSARNAGPKVDESITMTISFGQPSARWI
jgi:hypothetical protein